MNSKPLKLKKPNVFVTNRSCHDFSPAERFGRLVFLSDGPVRRLHTSVMYRFLYEGLKNSKPSDFLLVTGMTVMNVVAAGILGKLHGRLNLLLYDPSEREAYVERTVMIGGEE